MNSKYWLAFSSIEQIDSAFILKLYEHFKDIKKAFQSTSDELSQIEGLSIKKAENFLKFRDKTNPDKIADFIAGKNIKYLTFEDEKYPQMLKNIDNPPAVLYYKGDLKNVNLQRTLAVVGSRRASSNAKDDVHKIIGELSGTDITIVSGLASGIDTCAHIAALDSNSNKQLYSRIENGNGVIFSEYFPTFEPLKFRFPQRNRIVSGLSYGTLVAEASLKSGALITANLTLEQGRELMCIPGLISNPNTQGIYKLLKNGATLVTCADDILNALNWEVKSEIEITQSDVELTDDEQKIYNCLEIEEKGADELIAMTRLPLEFLLINLTMMELKGIIKKVDGDRYKRI